MLPLSNAIAEQTITYRKIKLPDAVIASTALVQGFTLITRNIGDFLYLPGLQIVNPFEENR